MEVKEMEECRYQARKDCTDVNRVLLDLNPEHTYNFLLAALQMGLIDLKHWFLLTNMMEAVFTFDAIYTFANTFTDVSAAMMVSGPSGRRASETAPNQSLTNQPKYGQRAPVQYIG
ncbi:hypothetical protein TELCIR_21612 [Teladorsagia circumcincta]|uniref:Uncharacterized protein n=1 Tax=Teladorsagia circumcincta TaxID=45464 RepID=A0A2G9TG97_TELCI|nr:hypothetical protein TELCIR_21612 [Teladorsagia circumcincta]